MSAVVITPKALTAAAQLATGEMASSQIEALQKVSLIGVINTKLNEFKDSLKTLPESLYDVQTINLKAHVWNSAIHPDTAQYRPESIIIPQSATDMAIGLLTDMGYNAASTTDGLSFNVIDPAAAPA